MRHKTIDNILGERVAVYRNLHKDCFSVQLDGLVVLHIKKIYLEDVEFKVSDAGRERVRKEQVKNVHAKVWGTVVRDADIKGSHVYYNPYKVDTFVVEDEPIHNADACVLKDNKVFI